MKKRNRKKINVHTIDIKKQVEEALGKTKQSVEDPFSTLTAEGNIIEPPFDLLVLAMLPENNTELGQCLDAMEVNIEAFGYRFVPRYKGEDDKLLKKIKEEKVKLINFFAYCTSESYTDYRRKLRKDLEATGNCFSEVIRDKNGNIQSFSHIPSYQMRLGRLDKDPIYTKRPILQMQTDGSVKIVEQGEYKRFRKFVQCRTFRNSLNRHTKIGYKTVWFKEFGDKRIYDCRNGEEGDETLSEEFRANEVIYRRIYSPRTPYGLPRTIGMLLSIYGARAAEEINFITFKNNNVPSMIIAVSNGQLNEASIDRIQEYAESIKKSNDYSKFLILEAEGYVEGEDGGQVKIDVKPLVSSQHKDALFQNYTANIQDGVRRAFRLPPIFVGRSDDYTRATAESSRTLADEQIFAPERDSEDEFMNRIIFPDLGILYHNFKTNSPNTTDNQQLVKILAGAEKTGGMTPRIARMLLEDILGMELPKFKENFDPDVPFSMTMAEAVKNMAQANEPGQQITALKDMKKNIDSLNDIDKNFIDYLMEVNDTLEHSWSSDMEEDEQH